jgi:hypothetical protein
VSIAARRGKDKLSSSRDFSRFDHVSPKIDTVYFTLHIVLFMPRKALTKEEIEEFRQRAVVVATRLFARGGIEGLTMRAIAQGLRCSPMTPYRYFDNQEHLLAEVRASAFERLAEDQARSRNCVSSVAATSLSLKPSQTCTR